MRLDFKVTEQTLEALPTNSKPRRGSKHYLELGFSFSVDWAGLTATAFLQHEEHSDPILLNEDCVIRVPDYYASQDSFLLVLLGSDGESSVPTNAVSISLDESGRVWTSTAPDVETSTYEKLVALAAQSLASAEEAKEATISEVNATLSDDDGEPSVETWISDGGKKRTLNFAFHNIGKRGKSAYELAVEDGFKGTLQDWLHSLVELLGEHTLTRYAMALTEFCDRDPEPVGLPIYDPFALSEFAPMLIERSKNETKGSAVEVLSKGATMDAVKLGAIDVTDAYKKKLAEKKDLTAKEFLWTLPAGRYYLVDSAGDYTTRYHLHAMAGELGDDEVIARQLYDVSDFCCFYFYCGNSAYDATPELHIDETGAIYVQGVMLGSGSGKPEIDVGSSEMPEGCVLQIDLEAEDEDDLEDDEDFSLTDAEKQEIAEMAAQLVDVPTDEEIRQFIADELGAVEAALEALL